MDLHSVWKASRLAFHKLALIQCLASLCVQVEEGGEYSCVASRADGFVISQSVQLEILSTYMH